MGGRSMINPAELVEQFNQMYNQAVNSLWLIIVVSLVFLVIYGLTWTYVVKRNKVYK